MLLTSGELLNLLSWEAMEADSISRFKKFRQWGQILKEMGSDVLASMPNFINTDVGGARGKNK